jgi:hypothetical protein
MPYLKQHWRQRKNNVESFYRALMKFLGNEKASSYKSIVDKDCSSNISLIFYRFTLLLSWKS